MTDVPAQQPTQQQQQHGDDAAAADGVRGPAPGDANAEEDCLVVGGINKEEESQQRQQPPPLPLPAAAAANAASASSSAKQRQQKTKQKGKKTAKTTTATATTTMSGGGDDNDTMERQLAVQEKRCRELYDASVATTTTTDINEHDVLCGRGNGVGHHVGNQQFRSHVLQMKPRYGVAGLARKAKYAIVIDVILMVLENGGRFLSPSKQQQAGGGDGTTTVSYTAIPFKKAVDKTSQALREGFSNNNNAAGGNNTKSTSATAAAAAAAAAASSNKKAKAKKASTSMKKKTTQVPAVPAVVGTRKTRAARRASGQQQRQRQPEVSLVSQLEAAKSIMSLSRDHSNNNNNSNNNFQQESGDGNNSNETNKKRKKKVGASAVAAIDSNNDTKKKQKTKKKNAPAAIRVSSTIEQQQENSSAGAIIMPTSTDVLLGRGNAVAYHEGNRIFREFCRHCKPEYDTTTRLEKRGVAHKVIEMVRAQTPPGRFVEETNGAWGEVPYEKVINKICQALREKKWHHPSAGAAGAGAMPCRPMVQVPPARAHNIQPVAAPVAGLVPNPSQHSVMVPPAPLAPPTPSTAVSSKNERNRHYTVPPLQQARTSDLAVGCRIYVFFPQDGAHYGGSVQDLIQDRYAYVGYDDGDCEWVDLTQFTFKVPEGSVVPHAAAGSAAATEPTMTNEPMEPDHSPTMFKGTMCAEV